ncbi:hypothetical protein NP233_g12694 [Leucocoprinus birnbaumii]|uniref:F-box domain-containing protein n=1 Tax=Leucocoprinus birnbaumii TaxID=56174 RepID=A0AAD5VDY6_9AGAR|nr:hypothetical protein NP233_g12694 [Leucocoprinus birnbaumii]
MAPELIRTQRVPIDYEKLLQMDKLALEAMSHSRSLRNLRTSFLARFPPEVVALIVSFLQPELPNCMPFTVQNHPEEWISATHVCRHWRDATLSAPALWNRLFLTPSKHPECAVEQLRRSGTLPFTLHYSGFLPGEAVGDGEDSEDIYNSMVHILAESDRLQHLHLPKYLEEKLFVLGTFSIVLPPHWSH